MAKIALLALLFLAACAQAPVPAQKPPAQQVQQTPPQPGAVYTLFFEPTTGQVSLRTEDKSIALGQILKSGDFEVASGVTGQDLALAVLVVVKSLATQKMTWDQIAAQLPR